MDKLPEVSLGSDDPLYNIGVVTHMTNISTATLRAWERRYNFPQAERTSGGHRLYSEHDILRLLLPSLKPISLKEVKQFLTSGNINDRRVMVPDEYSEFKDRWELEFFFDPSQFYESGFDPFGFDPISYSVDDVDLPSRINLRVDLRYPLKEVLVPKFQHIISLLIDDYGMSSKKRGTEPYTNEEIYAVRRCLREGKTRPVEIWRRVYPKFRGIASSTSGEANPSYRKLLTLIQREKKLFGRALAEAQVAARPELLGRIQFNLGHLMAKRKNPAAAKFLAQAGG